MFFSMLALAWSMAAKAWSSLATMVRCSSRGGIGMLKSLTFFTFKFGTPELLMLFFAFCFTIGEFK